MLWIKIFHLFFVISWFAGIFYLPRLFVNHAVNKDTAHHELLSGMEHRLIKMMNFTLIFVLITGTLFLYKMSNGFSGFYFKQGWLHAKLTLVALLIAYHFWCIKIHNNFKTNNEIHSHVWFRWFNEMPVFALLGILYLVIFKPF
ncbi:MAG TPA: CopD family protein [Gammaproteobacteria bacterium]|nr:CopD family protein [Xanthomonadales bacterium]MCB1593768.1 CopD family protein [Xanthomonadales bacterium]HOP21566.1 CopD family protein [Gammaproteobacteria bacterium]HPI94720.1 CopD family protein [Gammaproteobacteria bacterium]HPQ86165.1 CopD family protein [Gammaproteobacteria bacterium]